MRKIIILLSTLVLFVALCVAPAFAGPGCCASKKSKDCGMPPSACPMTQKADKGANCSDIVLVIEGMSGSDCEAKISKALGKLDGVICVEKISSTDGKAVICYNPEKAKTDAMIQVVKDAGYTVKSTESGTTVVCSMQKSSEESKTEVK